MASSWKPVGRRAGMTLIELVVVVAILAVLAGLVLPRLDNIMVRANKSQGASNMHGVSRYVQTHMVMNNVYPDNWDSLLDTAGNRWTAGTPLGQNTVPSTDWGLHPSLTSGPAPLGRNRLTTSTIATTTELRSLARMGISTVLDVDPALVNANSPGNAFRAGNGGVARTLAVGGAIATLADGVGLIKYFYPQSNDTAATLPPNKRIIVLGLGRSCTINADTLQEPPSYHNQDMLKFYYRYLCVFEFDTTGGRARLLGSLAADGDTIEEEIVDFYKL